MSPSPLRYVVSTFMVLIGITHFTHGELFASIVPPYLPEPLLLVYVSGVFEIALGLMLLVERTRVLAAWGLVALFVAVFPANIHMALHPEIELVGLPAWMPKPSPLAAWLRLPFQGLFLYAAYRLTRRDQRAPA